MPNFLFTVDDVFDISGRYVIPTPGVPVSVRGIKAGLPIELRSPDGTVLQTKIASVPLVDPYDPKRATQIALQGVTKQDIPPAQRFGQETSTQRPDHALQRTWRERRGVASFACIRGRFPALMAAAIKKEDIALWAAKEDLVTTRG